MKAIDHFYTFSAGYYFGVVVPSLIFDIHISAAVLLFGLGTGIVYACLRGKV